MNRDGPSILPGAIPPELDPENHPQFFGLKLDGASLQESKALRIFQHVTGKYAGQIKKNKNERIAKAVFPGHLDKRYNNHRKNNKGKPRNDIRNNPFWNKQVINAGNVP